MEQLVRDYNLDGLKIDFLDSISMHSRRKEGARNETLGSSLYHLLRTVTECLLALKPDLLVEFRNSYTNLASRSYANIYRSSDVPINFALNRWQAVMMRLLAPDRAVHLDPALWHPDDSDTNVAVHLINLLVSVPMVSIELDQYPQSHIDLIRYWIGFYNTHRNTLIHGEFKPILGFGYIPAVYFIGASETIITAYDDVSVSLESEARTVWLLNASSRSFISLISAHGKNGTGKHMVILRDKFGCVVSEELVHFPMAQIDIEVGGSVEIIMQGNG
jgi:alpha-galactosidase